jgi:adenine/guanine phosphoribosyltransferase-like PRPP-binding protein
VLIDDVVTTGETVRAAIALFPPGKVVGVVAVALVLAPPRSRLEKPVGEIARRRRYWSSPTIET